MKSSAIAIVGMAGRFPGARNVSEFWKNLRDGVEAIRHRSDEELRAAGATAEDLANPAYVKRASILNDVDLFDASFFGFSPRDASIMDPQHRHFLECAWEALEDSAHPPQSFDGAISVFAGSGLNSYLIYNLLANQKMVESAGLFQLKQTGNDKDVLATRASYQFDLRGPSINVQTACSTSLVAIHLACQSLLNFECDMALAGGVTIEIPHGLGYLYREGEILARDGHCRSFDASSSGTVFGSGLGIVVLRRLEDAVASSDHIRAVILGSAINNDGSRKVGYLAPSVEGQVEVIREAMEFAGVAPADISYVETHGTGTVVGDPIEVRALTQAFRHEGTQSGSCAIGSVKSNVGHLDAAAGVTGLIKTVLALENAQLPPSLHFETLNPRIDLSGSPFFVNNKLALWNTNRKLRRAGVTALGIGGTNAHVVLEEAPERTIKRVPKPHELLTVSAKSAAAADATLVNLVAHLAAHHAIDLGDTAWTCQVGRQPFAHRRALVVENSPQAIAAIVEKGAKASATGAVSATRARVAFLFSGQGSQYVGMGHELYEHEPVFREMLDRCARVLQPLIGIDLIEALYPSDGDKDAVAERLNQTWLTQPALFSIEYALTQWWMSLGIEPAAMVGHSIGEYVAACLAGVFSLEDALTVVAERGRLIYGLPAGAMLAVPLPANKLEIDASLSLAAINNPEMCVVSGPTEAIAEFERRMAEKSITCRRLYTSHAFHSSMMEPILSAFEEKLRGILMHSPQRPYLSNVTGTWIKPEEATNPAYWARHIRQTVRFSACLAELFRTPGQILLEAGPGNVLTSLARAQGGSSAKAYQTLPHPRENVSALRCALQTTGQLWVAGIEIDWSKLRPGGSAARVSLPTYPFEHHRYWIEPDRLRAVPLTDSTALAPPTSQDGPLVYRRAWMPAPLMPVPKTENGLCVLFRDELGPGNEIAARLAAERHKVVVVDPGANFKRFGSDRYSVRPGAREDYDALVRDIRARTSSTVSIIHLWAVTREHKSPAIDQALERSFFSPLYLAQALGAADVSRAKLLLVSNGLQQVFNEAVRDPERAVLLGPAGVISKELPNIICRAVDIDADASQSHEHAAQIVAEVEALSTGMPVAWRNGKRFVEAVEGYDLADAAKAPRIEQSGVYLITGGLGALGLAVAEHLARAFKARLVLVGRTAVEPEDRWEECLNDPQASVDEKARVRKLMEIRGFAGGLLVAQGDVTNLRQMQEVVAQARKQFRKIDGVFHCAGVLADGPLLTKTADAAQRVLDPKVRGTMVLEEALRDEKLGCFVLFSSISAINPPVGQVDYAAANAFLDTFARSRKGAVVAIDWDAWREAGMAASSTAFHPLLEKRLKKTAKDIVFATQLSIDKQWLLAEHRLKTGAALIPGTGYMEMAAGAFAAIGTRGPVELRDVFFLAPLSVGDRETKDLRIQLHLDEGAQSADFRFSIVARGSGSGGDAQWTEHSTGSIGRPSGLSLGQVDYRSIAARCAVREMRFDDAHRTKQEQFFNFGARWQCLRSLHIGDGEGLAEIELDARFAAECESFQFHPPMLDLATGCALYLINGYESFDDLYLPISYKRLRSYRPLPGHFFSHIRSRKENRAHGDLASFDITLFNARDEVLAEIDGFAMRRISDPSAAANEELSRHATVPMPITDSSVEATGIATRDGIEILQRVLMADTPSTLIVAQRDMEAFVGAQRNPAAVSVVTPTPRDSEDVRDIEATLCTWFKDLLGVETVALEDDFFALGGHSLVGVRLFAKIRNAYQVDLELAALFEYRTVRALADRIRGLQQPIAKPTSGTCLIAIQPKGSRPPIFFVHAVGGEVLYYEPLTRALGNVQPFFAFQSKLANQVQIGPTSMKELATAYLRELRREFPRGPYILGGHSYGGLVAFEMAQQLAAEGLAPRALIMLDAYIPGCSERLTRSAQWADLCENLHRDGLAYLAKKANAKRIYLGERFVRKLRLMACAGYRAAGRRLPASLRYFLVEEMHFQALWAYSFQPYPGDLQLIRATDYGVGSLSERRDPKLGWGKLVQGELSIYDVDADHSNIVSEPFVQTVADKIQQIIRHAETSAGQHSAKNDSATAASPIPEHEVLVAHQ